MQPEGTEENRDQQIKFLACGVSLISFELFQGGMSDWRPHLDVLVSIAASMSTSLPSEVSAGSLSSSITNPSLLQWQGPALSFQIPVVLWFELLSCASTGRAPQMPYEYLLESCSIQLETVM